MWNRLSRAEWQLAGAAVCLAALAVFGPALAQYADYHAFADQREALGLPSALNVLSNLPFALGGFWGLRQIRRRAATNALDSRWWAAALFFAGLVTTAIGSGIYHWTPDDFGLTLDRLGMLPTFAGLAAMAAADRVSERSAVWVVAWMAMIGIPSAWWWLHSGNLLPWAVVQGGGLLLVGLLALQRPIPNAWDLPWAKVVALYLVAKVFELADQSMLDLTLGLVSGHTLKHLVAAAVVLPILKTLSNARVMSIKPNKPEPCAKA